MSQSVKIIINTFPNPKQIHKTKLILSLGREVPDYYTKYWSFFDVMILEVQECSTIKSTCLSNFITFTRGHFHMRDCWRLAQLTTGRFWVGKSNSIYLVRRHRKLLDDSMSKDFQLLDHEGKTANILIQKLKKGKMWDNTFS